jgi:hypothetical protein
VVAHGCDPSTEEVKAGDLQFEASLGYIVKPCLKKEKKKNSHKLLLHVYWTPFSFGLFNTMGCAYGCKFKIFTRNMSLYTKQKLHLAAGIRNFHKYSGYKSNL